MKRNKYGRIPMNLRNLQFFAEGAEGSQGGEQEAAETSQQVQEQSWTPPTSQSEYDAAVNKAVQKALANANASKAQDIQAAVQEALKKEKNYAQLSEQERQVKEFEDQRAEFEKEKAEFAHAQLVVQIKEDLVGKSLPVEFAETLALFGSTEKVLEEVGKLEGAFKVAVAEEVKASVRQRTPGASGSVGESSNYGEMLGKGAGSLGGPIV